MGYRILEISKSIANNGDEFGLTIGMLLISCGLLCGLLSILSLIDEVFCVEYMSLTLVCLLLGGCFIGFNSIWDEKLYKVTYICEKTDLENADLIVDEDFLKRYKVEEPKENSDLWTITTKDSYTKEELEDSELLKKFE